MRASTAGRARGRTTPRRVRFDDFVLDADDESLWRGEGRISLRGKSFAVLQCLLATPGRLVTREQLIEAVWPDASIHEQGLSVCIKEVRAALDDDPREPRYVETVHRRGYRFLAEVVPLDEGAGAQTVTHDESAESVSRGVRCVFTRGAAVSHEVPLVEGARELGRGTFGAFSLDDGAISRRHVRITCVHGGWRVEDCGSKNGSFVDGIALASSSVAARAGAIVRLGETLLVLVDDLAREPAAASIVRALVSGAGTTLLRASFVERALLDPTPRDTTEWSRLAELAADSGEPLTGASYPGDPSIVATK